MEDLLETLDASEDLCFFVYPIRRNENYHRLPDDFRSRVSEEFFRPTVPAGNNPIRILAGDGGDDRVVGRLDDCHHLSRHCYGVVDIHEQAALMGRALLCLSLRGKKRDKCQIIDVVLKASNFLDSIFHRATSSLCG